MKIKNVIEVLESWAPPSLQESYDNSGLIVGDKNADVDKCIVCLDCIEEVVDEAISKNAQLIVAHHPIVFSGLKSFTGKNYIERVVIKAIQNNIAIYAIHTNLDNVNTGVNFEIGNRLGLLNLKVLAPVQGDLLKLVTYVPLDNKQSVIDALFLAGAGEIGEYSNCSFSATGLGTFKGSEHTNPFVGEPGELHAEEEVRVEVILPKHLLSAVLSKLKESHPYEEVAYDVFALENANQNIGAGMIGVLPEALEVTQFLKNVKSQLNTKCIRHTQAVNDKVKTVAFCGGSGSFLLNDAIRAKADVFITGDFKYHQFFDADNKLMILDVGHFESEQFTIELIARKLQENFPIFAVLKTDVNTNPISYF